MVRISRAYLAPFAPTLKGLRLLSYRHFAMNALTAQLTVTSFRRIEDSHVQVNAHCQAHPKKPGGKPPGFGTNGSD